MLGGREGEAEYAVGEFESFLMDLTDGVEDALGVKLSIIPGPGAPTPGTTPEIGTRGQTPRGFGRPRREVGR